MTLLQSGRARPAAIVGFIGICGALQACGTDPKAEPLASGGGSGAGGAASGAGNAAGESAGGAAPRFNHCTITVTGDEAAGSVMEFYEIDGATPDSENGQNGVATLAQSNATLFRCVGSHPIPDSINDRLALITIKVPAPLDEVTPFTSSNADLGPVTLIHAFYRTDEKYWECFAGAELETTGLEATGSFSVTLDATTGDHFEAGRQYLVSGHAHFECPAVAAGVAKGTVAIDFTF
jgi:hypothetical protein